MYTAAKTAERIKALAKKQGINQNALLEKIGSNKNGINSMSNRGSMPKADNLAKFADILNCSVDYLLGRTEVVEIGQTITVPLQDDEAALLNIYSQLDPIRKNILMGEASKLFLNLDGGEGSPSVEQPRFGKNQIVAK